MNPTQCPTTLRSCVRLCRSVSLFESTMFDTVSLCVALCRCWKARHMGKGVSALYGLTPQEALKSHLDNSYVVPKTGPAFEPSAARVLFLPTAPWSQIHCPQVYTQKYIHCRHSSSSTCQANVCGFPCSLLYLMSIALDTRRLVDFFASI